MARKTKVELFEQIPQRIRVRHRDDLPDLAAYNTLTPDIFQRRWQPENLWRGNLGLIAYPVP